MQQTNQGSPRDRYAVIVGSGSYLPERKVPNDSFLKNRFFLPTGQEMEGDNRDIVDKLFQISGIAERRYATDDLMTSDLAYFAAKDAIDSSGISSEELDCIIVAHNFGDVDEKTGRFDTVPSLAARVKHRLEIKNPGCIAYDLLFGCPGWVQGMIQADAFIQTGQAKKVLVIGSEALSRVSDPHDRDSMLYSDGAGAVILEGKENEGSSGIMAFQSRSDTFQEAHLLNMGCSNDPEYQGDDLFLKMDGRKIYQYALTSVPQVVKTSIENAGLCLNDIDKVLIHQANAKMDEAILKRLFSLCDQTDIPEGIMPMTIDQLGNNSVASVPIVYDLIAKGQMEDQSFKAGSHIVFTSVGAGMNINSLVYKV